MNIDDLLVDSNRWRMASMAIEPDGSVLMSVVPSTSSAICPVCGTTSSRRHTWYRRTALDLPWRKFTVRLRIWARRFFCDQPTCPRKIFAEWFTGLLPRYGRRTEEVTTLLIAIVQRAGGEAGARLARAAGLPTSPDTLRRLLRNQDFRVSEALAELGWMISRYTVDHWAMVCCSSTWESADRLTCCPTMSLPPWRPGFANIQVPTSSRVTVVSASETV